MSQAVAVGVNPTAATIRLAFKRFQVARRIRWVQESTTPNCRLIMTGGPTAPVINVQSLRCRLPAIPRGTTQSFLQVTLAIGAGALPERYMPFDGVGVPMYKAVAARWFEWQMWRKLKSYDYLYLEPDRIPSNDVPVVPWPANKELRVTLSLVRFVV